MSEGNENEKEHNDLHSSFGGDSEVSENATEETDTSAVAEFPPRVARAPGSEQDLEESDSLRCDDHSNYDVESKGVARVARRLSSSYSEEGNDRQLVRAEPLMLAGVTAPPPSSRLPVTSQQSQPGAFATTGRAEGERPAWEQTSPHTIQQQPTEATMPFGHGLSRSRSRMTSFWRTNNDLAEASPVDAEMVVYATSVSTEARQRRRKFCLVLAAVLITAVVVGTIVGTVVFTKTRSEFEPEESEPDPIVDPCDVTPRYNMKARMQCQCFTEIQKQAFQTQDWIEVKTEIQNVFNFSTADFNFSHTDCSVENRALWTLVELVNNTTKAKDIKPRNRQILLRDAYAGATFYIAFDGDNWFRKDNWMTLTRACTWFGVDCSIAGHVAGFTMPNNNLRGTFEFGVILPDRLRELILFDNAIGGTLPANFFHFETLRLLDLHNNNISGELPKSYEMNALRRLDLSNNSISGTFPSAFPVQMAQLRKLRLDRNKMTGTLPTTIQLMSSLEHFELGQNNFIGTLPPNMEQWDYLEIFSVRDNNLTGHIPNGFGELSQIFFLDLSLNQLSGTVPRKIRDCSVNRFVDVIILDCESFVNETCRSDDDDCCVCSRDFQPYDDLRLVEHPND